MPIAWFIVPYKRVTRTPLDAATRADILANQGMLALVSKMGISRYPAVMDFNSQIAADGGKYSCTEVLGDRAIVKVNASAATLTAMNNAAGFIRVPLSRLDDPLSSLTDNQRTALKNELLDQGYTMAEVNARFPDLSTVTLGDVLRFAATRRKRPRYDSVSDAYVEDGQADPVVSVDDVDGAVN